MSVYTRTHTHTPLPQPGRSVTASDRLSSLHSIIHVVCGLAGTLFISWLDPVLLAGAASQWQLDTSLPLSWRNTTPWIIYNAYEQRLSLPDDDRLTRGAVSSLLPRSTSDICHSAHLHSLASVGLCWNM